MTGLQRKARSQRPSLTLKQHKHVKLKGSDDDSEDELPPLERKLNHLNFEGSDEESELQVW